ncbi:hypothetical protein [Reyranella sp.]|uniref:hypothetical protein n=1 Tax=Reyranella sp. TaxID=1929291 RepID=UPI0037832C9D
MDDVTLARAVHVLSVIHWIGGVAFVTLVVLPLARIAERGKRLALFVAVERRFSAQVKVSVPLAGLSGFYMAERLDAWPRLLDPSQWWLGAMMVLWLAFMVVLFVVEPLLGGRLLDRADPDTTLRLVERAHWLLLGLATIVAASAVLGAHGMLG